MGHQHRVQSCAGIALFLAVGCDARPEPDAVPRAGELLSPTDPSAILAPLPAAHCEVVVDGVGQMDLETDYLPNVLFCENNGANLEALKVQAIAARSTAYYAMETAGSICDSQNCQVFSCGGTPGAIHIQAVEETSGMYLAHGGTLTYGFYVAGAVDVSPPNCVGVAGPNDTEEYVTYNEGLVQQAVQQTTLGFVFPPDDPGAGQNRGCMAQLGSRCLEDSNGYDADDILRFYYGEDIEVLTAQGDCVLEPDPTGSSSGGDSTGGPVGSDTTADSGGPNSGSDDSDDSTDPGGGTGGASAGDDGDPSVGGGEASGEDTDASGALPGGFGESQDGCACVAGPRPEKPPLAMLSMFVLCLLRRRRR